MASNLFALPSYKNVGLLFERIASAKAPEAFTQIFLSKTLGITGSSDRPLINLLKKLGFLDSTGKPTSKYARLKNPKTAGRAIAEGIREAYAPLFAANEKANELQKEDLKGVISQVAGTDETGTKQILYTLLALIKQGDFSVERVNGDGETVRKEEAPIGPLPDPGLKEGVKIGGFRGDFNFNVQVHLPSNGSEETYINIFNAVRKAFS